jgi:LysM repeat protein
MSRRAMVFPVAALAALLATTGAPAGERTHTVRKGESASAIAKHYYGDYELANLLLALNDRAGTMIRPGEELRVPYCEVHRVRAGDSWSGLAQRYLERSSAYPTVAALNGLPPEAPLRVGQTIVMPVILTHRLRRGESLSSIAERFYDGTKTAALLQEFNRIEDPRRLSIGEPIEIPLITLRLVPGADEPAPESAKTDPAPVSSKSAEVTKTAAQPEESSVAEVVTEAKPPAAEPAAEAEPVPGYRAELRSAATKYRHGDYERARTLLESIRKDVQTNGTAADRSELGRLLAFVYVAFDLPEEACAAYALTGASPKLLDADRISPKIRLTLSRCPDPGA